MISLNDLSPIKSVFDQYVDAFPPAPGEEQPADVYAYYNLMLRAQAAFREIVGRWDALGAWGVQTKLPGMTPAFNGWLAFSKAWSDKTQGGAFAGLDDMQALRNAAVNLNSVEHQAQALGFRQGDRLELVQVPTEAEQDQAVIDVTTGVDNAFAKANMSIHEKEQEAKALAAAAAQKLKDLPSGLWSSIPWYVKLGGAVAALALVAGAVRR